VPNVVPQRKQLEQCRSGDVIWNTLQPRMEERDRFPHRVGLVSFTTQVYIEGDIDVPQLIGRLRNETFAQWGETRLQRGDS